MTMKHLIAGLAFTALLACGGVEDPQQDLDTPGARPTLATKQQLSCDGYHNQTVSQCSYKCTSADPIYSRYPAGWIAYGDCTWAAQVSCGWPAYSTCWSTVGTP